MKFYLLISSAVWLGFVCLFIFDKKIGTVITPETLRLFQIASCMKQKYAYKYTYLLKYFLQYQGIGTIFFTHFLFF